VTSCTDRLLLYNIVPRSPSTQRRRLLATRHLHADIKSTFHTDPEFSPSDPTPVVDRARGRLTPSRCPDLEPAGP
jgi:hypothetical protein